METRTMARLTFEDVENRVKRFSYKPGWFFQVQEPLSNTLYEHPETIAIIVLNAYVVDSLNPDEIIGTSGSCRVMGDQVECLEDLDQLVWDLTLSRETHEMREWLKFDDQHVDYPHEDHLAAEEDYMDEEDLEIKTISVD